MPSNRACHFSSRDHWIRQKYFSSFAFSLVTSAKWPDNAFIPYALYHCVPNMRYLWLMPYNSVTSISATKCIFIAPCCQVFYELANKTCLVSNSHGFIVLLFVQYTKSWIKYSINRLCLLVWGGILQWLIISLHTCVDDNLGCSHPRPSVLSSNLANFASLLSSFPLISAQLANLFKCTHFQWAWRLELKHKA